MNSTASTTQSSVTSVGLPNVTQFSTSTLWGVILETIGYPVSEMAAHDILSGAMRVWRVRKVFKDRSLAEKVQFFSIVQISRSSHGQLEPDITPVPPADYALFGIV